jgi:hypothetical protein
MVTDEGFVAQMRPWDSWSESGLAAGCDEQAETYALPKTNWFSYNAALKKRGSLTVWFDPSMNWEGLPAGRRGRQPGYSTLSRRQKFLTVDIPYRGSDGPLHLLINSTGIKVEGAGEWHWLKHDGSKRRI